jgi:hypothetical protein
MPAGEVIGVRPLPVNAPTRRVGDTIVEIDAARPFEFLVIAPTLACTGWTRFTPEYARIEPTAPVGPGPENVYSAGSEAPATRMNIACASGLEAVVQAVWTTAVQPVGAAIAIAESERNATAARRIDPVPAPAGRETVNVWAGVAVAALVADAKVGVAAGASPSRTPPSATAAAATDNRRPVILGTNGL